MSNDGLQWLLQTIEEDGCHWAQFSDYFPYRDRVWSEGEYEKLLTACCCAIQAAMGWTNSHLHFFNIGDSQYGVPDEDWIDDLPVLPVEEFTLAEALIPGGQALHVRVRLRRKLATLRERSGAGGCR